MHGEILIGEWRAITNVSSVCKQLGMRSYRRNLKFLLWCSGVLHFLANSIAYNEPES